MTAGPARAALERIFRAACAAADPEAAVRRAITRTAQGDRLGPLLLPPDARLVVLAAGKAAAAMAAGLEATLGDRIRTGLVVTKEGHGLPLARLPVREAGHPVPDVRSEAAGRAMLRLAAAAAPSDVGVVLLSGGASALLATPVAGLTLDEIAGATLELLACGADIEAVNAVRKHLLELAGGRLAQRAACEQGVLLAVSDVLGDRLDVIGSGPCSADPTTFADALAVLARFGIRERFPPRVVAHLEAGARGEREETAKPGDARLARVRTAVLASNRTALAAARLEARRCGLRAVVVSDRLAGEARRAGACFAALALAASSDDPLCLLAGGETTVTLRDAGLGGRCQELALAAALAFEGKENVALLAAATDGTDGPTDAAGAFVNGASVARGARQGADARAALARHDAYRFFEAEGGLFRTGPTRTNVLDLVLAWRAAGA